MLQEDVFFPFLTVRETLTFAAQLRLPGALRSPNLPAGINTILTKFGLEKCGDTIIGNQVRRGISGSSKSKAYLRSIGYL